MEKKAVVLAPPVILSPTERDEVETLELKGTGEVGCAIFVNSNFMNPAHWERVTNVEQDGSWKYSNPSDHFESPKQDAWIRVRQEHWNGGTSEPSPTVFFTKLLAPSAIAEPSAGGSLPRLDQIIKGTSYSFSNTVEIELTLKSSPIITYQHSVTPDLGGWWSATPKWSLTPGSYELKTRQFSSVHTSRWSDPTAITVE
ncbi:hypothetical protein [Pseudomonas fluorescens]|uniref:hypothetical protein n=1 Tax=Pseudomonas fluorescens TaxID=294 RepID=UPI003D1D6B2C